MKKLTYLVLIAIFTFTLSGCGIYKRADVKDVPTDVNERVQEALEEGRGIKFGKLKGGTGGTFDFASSNELWRASIEILDFVTFTNASYSGGIIITDWFNSNKDDQNKTIKITVRFLSNEIRADGIEVVLHERVCLDTNLNSCKIKKIKSKVQNEIKLAILKKATILQKQGYKKKKEEFKKSGKKVAPKDKRKKN